MKLFKIIARLTNYLRIKIDFIQNLFEQNSLFNQKKNAILQLNWKFIFLFINILSSNGISERELSENSRDILL